MIVPLPVVETVRVKVFSVKVAVTEVVPLIITLIGFVVR